MDALFAFVENQPILAIIGLTIIIVILRLFGIGKKLITWTAIVIIAGGSVYIAKTMN